MAKSSFFNSDTPSDPTTNTSFYQGGEQEAEQVEGSFFENNNGDYVPVATLEGLAEQIEEDLGAATEQANAAAASATAAAGSASSAATSASNASASASAAAGSASAAHASETAAAASAAAAAASASNASSSASAAAASASSASTSATNASNSASAAAGSASSAATSATNASNSATAAAQSASDAAAAAGSVPSFPQETSIIYAAKAGGSDANSGRFPYLPKLTIAAALTAASALIGGGVTRAEVLVLDAGVYTENLTVPANVTLHAPNATLVGTLVLSANANATLLDHYAASSSTTMLTTADASGSASHYEARIVDGRGTGGALTGVTCMENASSGRVLMLRIKLQVFIPSGGFGIRDNAGSGFGHVHFQIPDLYLAGNNAIGLRSNNANTNLIGYIDHILEIAGNPTGTTGIKIGASGGTVKLTASEIDADTVYSINAAGTCYLQCPKQTGAFSGSLTNAGGWAPSAADRLLYGTGANTTAETPLTAFGRSLIDDADAAAARTTLALATIASSGSASDLSAGTVPAARMPAHTGDVTSTSGSVTLTIGNATVTYAKIQNVSATDKLLGRATAGAGSVEEITCTPFARTILDDADAATARSTLGAQASLGYTPLNAASNLSDVANASTARTNLGLGSAATLNVGTSANNVVQLDGSAKLPAVDGSQLTGISAGSAEPQGCCYLSKSSTNLLLSRRNGRSLWINGANESIPSGGVTLSTSGLSASTFYYIYAYMNAGTMTLQASTTAPTADTTYGHQIKTGDGTRSLVGAAYTDTGPAWADANGKLWVLSYFNRLRKGSRTNFTTNRTTTSTSGTEINSEIRCNFIAWGDTPTKVWQNTVALNSAGGNSVQGGNAVDSTSVYKDSCQSTVAVANGAACFAATSLVSGLTENATHYATVLGHVNAGTGTWISAQTALYVEVLG